MTASGSVATNLLGYLAFVECTSNVFVGGYLLVNDTGRPVEFHCTAPVCPSRTQQILFGATLRATLFCEQIGAALLKQAKRRPCLLLTDEIDTAGIRTQFDYPMAIIDKEDLAGDSTEALTATSADESPSASDSLTSSGHSFDASDSATLRRSWSFEFGGYSLTTVADYAADQDAVRATLRSLSQGFDLAEPFERIRTAIQEAQRAAA